MQMTGEEIVRDYNAAKNKNKQIKVLAELNAVSPGEIRAVLTEAGVPGVDMPKRIRPQKGRSPSLEPISEEREPHSSVVPPLESTYSRIEVILGSIPNDASSHVKDSALELMISMFREYLERRLGKGAA